INAVNSIFKGIKSIVEIVLKGKGDANATKTKDVQHKDIGKLFEKQANATETEAAAASASIGAVSGADMLQAIANSAEAKENVEINAASNAAELAVVKNNSATKTLDALANKDAVIAAGIALRAMAKDGKFAANNDAKHANAVNGAAASAVGKVLSTLTIAIRNAVDEGLKGISKVLGEIKQGEVTEAKAN
ncbi:Variable outer membrane protein, partial [Borrelia duttonii CR2A]